MSTTLTQDHLDWTSTFTGVNVSPGSDANGGDAAQKNDNSAPGGILGTIGDAAGAVGGALSSAGHAVVNAAETAGHAVVGAAETAGHAVVGAVETAGHAVVGAAETAGHAVVGAAETTGSAVVGAVEAAGHTIADVAETAGHAIVGAAEAVGHAVGGVIDDAEDLVGMGPKSKKVSETADKVTKMSDDDIKKLPTDQKVQLVKDLFANGKPSGDARKAQIKIYKDMELDPDFKKRESERGDRIADSLKDDKDLQDARQNWSSKSNADKVKAMNKIIAAQSKEYGFPPPEIVLDDPPQPPDANGSITNGHYSAPPDGDGKLHLNPYNDPDHPENSSSFNDFEKGVTTALHENGHNYQARLVKDLRAGKIKPGDPDYNQASMFDVNDDNDAYIQPSEDYDAYFKQPEENHARTEGPETAGKLNKALEKATK
jgi:hypothetical protein